MIEKDYISFVKECTSGWSQKENYFAILYSAGGIIEEAHELTEVLSQPKSQFREKVISEVGDMIWYMTAFMLGVGRTDEEILKILKRNVQETDTDIMSEAMPLHKKISKHVFYNEPLDGMEIQIATIISRLKFICEGMIGVNLEIVLTENIKKIDGRYPKGRHTEHVEKSVEDELSKMEIDGRDKGSH